MRSNRPRPPYKASYVYRFVWGGACQEDVSGRRRYATHGEAGLSCLNWMAFEAHAATSGRVQDSRPHPLFQGLLFRLFRSQSQFRHCWWYKSSHGTDFDISEMDGALVWQVVFVVGSWQAVAVKPWDLNEHLCAQ